MRFFPKLEKTNPDFNPDAFYGKPDSFFGPIERLFWDLLHQATGNRYRIFGRTRLSDILSIKPGLEDRDIEFARKQAESRCVDFVLCDPTSLSVIAVVELEDYDPDDERKAKKRDGLIGRMLVAGRIPSVRIKARTDYTALDVKLALREKIPEAVAGDNAAQGRNAILCPACGAAMVKRVVRKGVNIGAEFWGCSDFPKCKTSLSLDEI